MTNASQADHKALPPTALQIYSTTSLEREHADLLPPLTALINLCYSVGHTSSPHGVLLPYSYKRLATNTSLLTEVGRNGFVLVLSIKDSEGQEELIASASAKPFKELGHTELVQGIELLHHFKRRAAAPPPITSTSSSPLQTQDSNSGEDTVAPLEKGDDPPKWEIICNVVHPGYQKRGIAAQLFDALIREIRKREPKSGSKRVHFVITTMKEMNEIYYQKRGYVTTREQRFEKGVGGSEVGFSVVEMERII
ncbi:MAG: hypothetical protein Q9225_006596 [Loekoesia sp. 1 TL-2023]